MSGDIFVERHASSRGGGRVLRPSDCGVRFTAALSVSVLHRLGESRGGAKRAVVASKRASGQSPSDGYADSSVAS